MTTEAPTSQLTRSGLGRNYRRLFAGSMFTNLGDGLMLVAVMWLATTLTRNPLLIALVGVASRLPWLLFTLPAGVLADRHDRRMLVASMDVVRFVIVGVFGVVVITQQSALPSPDELAAGLADPPSNATVLLGLLYLVTLALGFAEVVRDNSAQTLMPAIVEKADLEKANGRLWGAENVLNNFIGPPLAGALLAVALALPFLLDAGFLAVSAVLIFGLRGNFRPARVGHTVDAPGDWRAEIVEGVRWLWSHAVLRALALLLGAMNMLSQVAFVVFVLYIQEILGLTEGWQYGVVLTGTAVGATLGSLLADRTVRRLSAGTALLVAMVGFALHYLVIAVTSSAVVVWSISVMAGYMIMLWNVVTVSLRQRIIPDHLLGRVNSVYRFFGWGTMSIGTLLGGLVVAGAEPLVGRDVALRTPFVLAGVASLLLLFYAIPRVNRRTIAAAEAAAAAADSAMAHRTADGAT